VLNPSPWDPHFHWGRLPISTLVVNEGEAARILRLPADELPKRIPTVRRRLARLAVGELVVTRGGASTLVFAPDRAFEVPVLPVRPIDTVGAGDAFAGTLAVRLAEGASLEQAVRAATCAGALATLAVGAQAALPTRRATDLALARLGPTRTL
jgi:ribokinase